MTKLEIAKSATSFVVAVGTSKIITQIIKNNTKPENLADVATMSVGAIVLGSMVADVTKRYTDHKIDEIVVWWQTNVKKNS